MKMEEEQPKRILIPTWSTTKQQDDDVPESKVGVKYESLLSKFLFLCFQPFRNTPMTLADPKSIHVFGEVGNKHLQTAGDMVEKVCI